MSNGTAGDVRIVCVYVYMCENSIDILVFDWKEWPGQERVKWTLMPDQ